MSHLSFLQRVKAAPGTLIVGIYAILIGAWFLVEQTMRLFLVAEAEEEIAAMAIGRFDWGFVWADTFLPGPLLFIGGLLVSAANNRLGHLFIFSGFAINLYAMLVFVIGFEMLGEPLRGTEVLVSAVVTLLGLFCMIYSAAAVARDRG